MYKLTIINSDSSEHIHLFYSKTDALKYTCKHVIEWLVNYYDIHYDANEYPFTTAFFNEDDNMVSCMNRAFAHINQLYELGELDGIIYPVEYEITEINFK